MDHYRNTPPSPPRPDSRTLAILRCFHVLKEKVIDQKIRAKKIERLRAAAVFNHSSHTRLIDNYKAHGQSVRSPRVPSWKNAYYCLS